MSWLFAIQDASGSAWSAALRHHDTPLRVVIQPGFYLAVGGSPDTSFVEADPERSSGWAVVGIGISAGNSSARILTRDDWARLLARESFEVSALDGHFAVLRWNGSRLECFTDQLGLRTLFFGRCEGGLCLSTRLEWLAQATASAELDLGSLSCRWVMYNGVTDRSGVSGVSRLGPAGRALFTKGSVERVSGTPWLPSFEPVTPAELLRGLKPLVECALDHQRPLSLGLSGGLDSRLLLALLTSSRGPAFGVHTFGATSDPDVRLASRLSATFRIPHALFDDPIPDTDTCIRAMQAFASETLLTGPVSSLLKLRYYPRLRDHAGLMIDGGFGEIARRRYLNRVVMFGRTALRRRDSARLLRLMRFRRADFFSNEMTALLEEGARRNLEEALAGMPAVERIGVENFADLFAVRTRVPYYGGPEQARLDSKMLNFMPLVQPSFLRGVFGMPARFRRNAAFHIQAIRTLNPSLARFPLSKGGVLYPFGVSNTLSWLITNAKIRLAAERPDCKTDRLFARLRDYVGDLAHSAEVRENPMYDHGKIVEAIRRYYGGDLAQRDTVDWWLTFELWRRSLLTTESPASLGLSRACAATGSP